MRIFLAGGASAVALALALAAAPAAAQNANLVTLTQPQTFPAWQSTMKYQTPASGTGAPSGFGNFAKVTSSVRYDPVGESYIIRDTGSTSKISTFNNSNRTGVTPTFTTYQKSSGGTTETFRRFNPGPGNPVIALTYTTYGHWRTVTPGAGWDGSTGNSDTYLVWGIKTAGSDMPRTGSATYTAVLDGTFANRQNVFALSGPASFAANWVNGALTFSATPSGLASNGATLAFGTVTGAGTINFANSSFNANPTGSTPYKMTVSGYFFGPAAAEIGANFRLAATNGSGNGVGAIVGKKN